MAVRKRAKKTPEGFHFSQEEVSQEGRAGILQERRVGVRMADDMRTLVREIINSFDARVATIAALRQEVAAKLHGVRQEMKQLRRHIRQRAADLKRFLSNAKASRMRDFAAMHEGIRAGQDNRSRQVGGMLSGFRLNREAAAGHWQDMAATMAKRRAMAR